MPRLKSEQSHALGHQNKMDRMRSEAMAGDMVFVITPETVAPLPTSEAWTRNVIIELQNAKGERHAWFNADITVAIADTSTAGTASIVGGDTTPPMVNGRCMVTVAGDAAAWLNTETDTLTLSDLTVMGNTVTGGTSVETFTT